MNKKGQINTFGWIAITVIGLLSIMAILASTNVITLSAQPGIVSALEYDGEFNDFTLPEEVAGTSLIANTSYAEASEAFTVAFESFANINATAGLTYQFASRMEIDGDLENFDVEVALGDALVTEFQITKLYILYDEEGVVLESTNPLYTGEVNSDQDEAEFKDLNMLEGDYVIVVEGRTLPAVSALLGGESILTMTFDATSDDSDAVDEGVLTIYNYI